MIVNYAARISSHRTLAGVTLAAAAVAVSVAVFQTQRNAVVEIYAPPLVTLSAEPFDESAVRDRDIELYTARITQDKSSALDRYVLASLLFTRSRYTGSVTDLDQAEALAREAIGLRTQRNYQAFELLATVLMAKHEFREAREIAERVNLLDPGVPSHLVLLGEIELEMGDYVSAASHFEKVNYSGQQFTISARLARWHEITGRTDIARRLLKQAIVRVDRRDDLPREQVAWFHYRLGELELRVGDIAAADSAFRISIERNPNDVRALGGLARSALARGDWKRAIEVGEKAITVQLDPATLGTVSSAYRALGDTVQAASYAKAMSVSALTQPGVIHRAWGLFLLDHGSARERATVLSRARLELDERKDVYGHDLMAWALYRDGQIAEAKREMTLALSQNTQDVMLAGHARAIGLRP